MRRSLSLPIVALFSTVPVVAQTTGAGAPPPASKPQDATAATETRKTRRILTNEDLSKSTGKISAAFGLSSWPFPTTEIFQVDRKNLRGGEWPGRQAKGSGPSQGRKRQPGICRLGSEPARKTAKANGRLGQANHRLEELQSRRAFDQRQWRPARQAL